MKSLISTTAIAALSLGLPALAQAQSSYHDETYNAHQACKKNEDKRQILGGLAGAVLGGVLGSQVSGNGARSEGSAIGAVVGGAAGFGLADKTVDCDPVYPESNTATYGGSYPAQNYPSHTSGGTYYGGATTVSQPVYTDQVTYSNHPVYSQPSYGAGAVNYGTTYDTGTTTYQPYTSHNTQSYTVSSPSYTQSYPAQTYQTQGYQTQSHPPVQNYQTQSYQTVTQTPSYHTTTYTRPVSRTTNVYGGARHYHGSYACTAPH